MWQKSLKKTIFLLNVNEYEPQITEITYPFIYDYAKKINAQIYTITERKFPEWPPVYEKLQIYQLAQEMENDWNIYIDSDTLIHPETIDWTDLVSKDTVLHNGSDMASIRWTYDRFLRRDGRNIGSCNWLAIASDLCIELWKPIDDMTLEEVLFNIRPTISEVNAGITKEHLIDDYALSRNIAKYGLKFKICNQLIIDTGMLGAEFFFHIYDVPAEEKIKQLKNTIVRWNLPEELFNGKLLDEIKELKELKKIKLE